MRETNIPKLAPKLLDFFSVRSYGHNRRQRSIENCLRLWGFWKSSESDFGKPLPCPLVRTSTAVFPSLCMCPRFPRWWCQTHTDGVGWVVAKQQDMANWERTSLQACFYAPILRPCGTRKRLVNSVRFFCTHVYKRKKGSRKKKRTQETSSEQFTEKKNYIQLLFLW